MARFGRASGVACCDLSLGAVFKVTDHRWHFSELDDEDVGDVLSSKEVRSRLKVCYEFRSVSLQSWQVRDGVCNDLLNELLWMLKDLGPLLDSGKVSLHALAVSQICRKVLKNLAN